MSGLNWLPNNYELQSNLEAWLALSWINEPIPRCVRKHSRLYRIKYSQLNDIYLFGVPNSHGLKDTMFKLIIPREPDSDEDLVSDVQDYDKEIKVENLLPFAQKENECNLMQKGESKDIIFGDDAGGTSVEYVILNFKTDRCTGNKLVSFRFRIDTS